MGISVMSGGPIGSGADFTFAGAASESYIVVDMAASGNVPKQVQSPNDVLTYPCEGITGTNWQLQGEVPSPIPSRNLVVAPIGHPIFVQAIDGNTLTVTSASMTGPLGSVALLPTMTSVNDPNSHLLPNQAIILPNAPLTPNKSYAVKIVGTNNGVAFTKNFTFATGK